MKNGYVSQPLSCRSANFDTTNPRFPQTVSCEYGEKSIRIPKTIKKSDNESTRGLRHKTRDLFEEVYGVSRAIKAARISPPAPLMSVAFQIRRKPARFHSSLLRDHNWTRMEDQRGPLAPLDRSIMENIEREPAVFGSRARFPRPDRAKIDDSFQMR